MPKLFTVLFAYTLISGCHGAGNSQSKRISLAEGQKEGLNVGDIHLGRMPKKPLPKPGENEGVLQIDTAVAFNDYDKIEISIYPIKNKQPIVKRQITARTTEPIMEVLPRGTYRYRLRYLKQGKTVLSNDFCQFKEAKSPFSVDRQVKQLEPLVCTKPIAMSR